MIEGDAVMSDADLTQISLGRVRVGINGLQGAIEKVKSLQGRPEAEIVEALFDQLKSRNYIPSQAREEYKRAFLREYKRALGRAELPKDQGGLVINNPGSLADQSCDQLEQTVMAVLEELIFAGGHRTYHGISERFMPCGVFGTARR